MAKTKEQLLEEISAMRKQISFLENKEQELEHIRNKLLKQTYDYKERIKELNCLYRMSDLVDNKNHSIDAIVQGTIDLIPSSWQYPDITCARALINHREYQTENFRITPWKQSVNVAVRKNIVGFIEVYYLEDRTGGTADPFLWEEWNLIMAIGERLGKIILRFEFEEKLKITNKQLRNLSTHLQTVREEERATIAREIHDEFGQVLTILKMDTYWLHKKLSHELQKKTGNMLNFINEKINIIQEYISQLRPKFLDDLSLPQIVKWQIEEFQKRTGIQCELNLALEILAVDNTISTAVFRILQESLTNVIRHARASAVKVGLRQEQQSLFLEISDNGRGITKACISNPESYGIIGMRERCLHLGGEITIRGSREKGTLLRIMIPLDHRKSVKKASLHQEG